MHEPGGRRAGVAVDAVARHGRSEGSDFERQRELGPEEHHGDREVQEELEDEESTVRHSGDEDHPTHTEGEGEEHPVEEPAPALLPGDLEEPAERGPEPQVLLAERKVPPLELRVALLEVDATRLRRVAPIGPGRFVGER